MLKEVFFACTSFSVVKLGRNYQNCFLIIKYDKISLLNQKDPTNLEHLFFIFVGDRFLYIDSLGSSRYIILYSSHCGTLY